MGFDFEGVFTQISPLAAIHYMLPYDRAVDIEFTQTPEGIRVVETFDAEDMNPYELQASGWQSILNNVKRHAELTAIDAGVIS